MVPTARAGWDPTKCPAYLLLLLLLVATSLVGPTRLQVSTLRFYWSLQDYKDYKTTGAFTRTSPFQASSKAHQLSSSLSHTPALPCQALPCTQPCPASSRHSLTSLQPYPPQVLWVEAATALLCLC
jgi:hypothetical protein